MSKDIAEGASLAPRSRRRARATSGTPTLTPEAASGPPSALVDFLSLLFLEAIRVSVFQSALAVRLSPLSLASSEPSFTKQI